MSGPAGVELGVALGAHTHDFETLLRLVRHAEALGYALAQVDGDVSMMGRRTRAPVLDGWSVTLALLERTERIGILSLRLPHHWNVARLAQAAATAQRLHGPRFRLALAAGGQPVDRRFGLAYRRGAERVAHLAETLEALGALWGGEPVTRDGRFVRLDGARVDAPAAAPPLTLAGRGRALLELVAEHAAVWDVNWPPVRARVERAAGWLAEACARRGRDPASVRRSMWLFTRPGREPGDPALEAEFREVNPWFAGVGPDELPEAVVAGDAARCRDRVMEIHQALGIDLPILDLTGLGEAASRRALEALAPLCGSPDPVVDPGESRT